MPLRESKKATAFISLPLLFPMILHELGHHRINGFPSSSSSRHECWGVTSFTESVPWYKIKILLSPYTPVNEHSRLENGPFEDVFPIEHGDIPLLFLMAEIRHHLGCTKPFK